MSRGFPALDRVGMRAYGAAIDANFRERRNVRRHLASLQQQDLQNDEDQANENAETNGHEETTPPSSSTHFQHNQTGLEHEWEQGSGDSEQTMDNGSMSLRQRTLYYAMYVLHFGLSKEEIKRMEQLMAVLYGTPPPVSYEIHVASLNEDILGEYNRQRYLFCASCNGEMSERQSACTNRNCAINGVNIKRAKRMQRIEVHVMNILPQLSDILVRDLGQIIEMHKHLHEHRGDLDRDRSDIRRFDGYYEHIETPDAFNQRRLKVLLSLSLDGFRARRISKREMWPLYLRVDSLCPKEANKYFNSIIAGAMYSRTKPTERMFETLFSRLESELHDLRDEPIEVDVDGELWKIEVELNRGIADMAAQQALFGTPKWNSEYGCSKCYIKGVRIDNHRVWIAGDDMDTTLRTRESYTADAEAQQYGLIKETSAMRLILPCDFPGDALHVCSEGVTRVCSEGVT